jgi:methylenetetrahydrofolate dehydrogenase (NADP+) / methenyltetrahydrofolate cyclohydrolase
MKILDGIKLSQKISLDLKKKISQINKDINLDIVLVGDDKPSLKYVQLKQKEAKKIGIGGQIFHLNQQSTTQEVISLIEKLNKNESTTAFMIQLPLPKQINTNKVLSKIDPQKDADGLSPFNLGLLFNKKTIAIPSATALGVMDLLDDYKIDYQFKNVVILGRSPEVSLPLFALFMAKDATVTICHSKTKKLKDICRQADILVSAIGKPNFLTEEFIKKGAVLVDVGFDINPDTNKVSGDFDFDKVKDLASYITPVPGGVGPMTVVTLLKNTLSIALKKDKI